MTASSGAQRLGSAVGVGNVTAQIVGPGRSATGQRFYAVVMYELKGSHFDLLSIDPDTGDTQVFPSPLAGEYGAYGIALGPDGNVYIGTLPQAHLMKFDTQRAELIDLGRPSSTETYIWALTFGSDNKLYGGTYPNCRLVRYDPIAGRTADLGRLDPVQQYAHYLAASKDGFIYAGVGPSAANVAAYQISTGRHQELLPASAQIATFGIVKPGIDGAAYAAINSAQFKLAQFSAMKVTASQVSPAPPTTRLNDGRVISLVHSLTAAGGDTLTIVATDSRKNTTSHPVAYGGQLLTIFRLALGPDGAVYGSTLLPANLFRLSNENSVKMIGNVGAGEIYSFVSRGNHLLMAGYYGLSTLMDFQPAVAFNTSNPANPGAANSPVLTDYLRTVFYLATEVENNGEVCHVFHGGMDADSRENALTGYLKSGGILTATRASLSEGITLSAVTDLVLYDVPSSPVALQQVLS